MKWAKLSLVAMAALSTMAYASSDTLADAFKNGKVTGDLRFVYTGGSRTDAVNETAPVNNVNVGSIAVVEQMLSMKQLLLIMLMSVLLRLS